MLKRKDLYTLLISMFIWASSTATEAAVIKKREFRGAWIQAVNGQFQGMSKSEMQRVLTYQLNELQRDGVNVWNYMLGSIRLELRPQEQRNCRTITLLLNTLIVYLAIMDN